MMWGVLDMMVEGGDVDHVHLDLVVAERIHHQSLVSGFSVVPDVVGVLARNVCGFGI